MEDGKVEDGKVEDGKVEDENVDDAMWSLFPSIDLTDMLS